MSGSKWWAEIAPAIFYCIEYQQFNERLAAHFTRQ